MNCREMRVAGFLDNSLVNGKGLRSVVFVSGCEHQCDGCHNKLMQDRDYGDVVEIDKVYNRIMDNYPLIQGVTFSGGEPFDSTAQLNELADKLKDTADMNIWCYTGYSFESIKKSNNKYWKALLRKIDVLVDGKFKSDLKDESLKYRGSKNQRVIDVKASLSKNKIICLAAI